MTTPRRRSLGRWLGFWIGASTALSLLVFTATAALVLYVDELRDAAEEAAEIDDDGDAGEVDDDGPEAIEFPTETLLAQVLVAFAIAAPVGLALSIAGARWLTHRATARIDAVIAAAARMSAEDLKERLPVTGAGDELDALASALNALFARIDGGIAAQRQFAADASHELRSPLAVLSSTLEVARRRPRAPAEWEDLADRTLDEVRRMSALVEALLQLARASGGVKRARVDLMARLDGPAQRWAEAAARAGVKLAFAGPDELVAQVDADALEIAIGNLVSNAVAYSPPGGTVTLEVRAEGAWLAVTVDDQGPGIPASERERIFAPFVRATAPTADRTQGRAGLGLGLAIARRIVEGHTGTLDVGEAPGGGARFTIRLTRMIDPGFTVS
ncbi:HAMP domain-containing sensor histidine kinase [Nannocystis sp. ILAH1]|uniref:sensor histidine kinase n=1 Tax=unclassified Nannocystis TaxID=2627009 RepID=UPI00226EB0F0|nr:MULTISPECIES: HAMP domain-containing sensor histidine kinase [unclassified Nannocystis]MCY0995063.1 HAMP domain-containing sensor histidine kinase [Nannocystis sp. ILAH1]MCY1069737.1 HAMP domain-containing sensor histidine kinase [Nannocystis sp. RBIL2]